MQAVILAAGEGNRLKPLTAKRSKAMLPILGKPIIERAIEHFASCGISDIIVVINPDDRYITRHFQGESHLRVDIRFVYQKVPLGTADALKFAAPLIEGDFFLSACDNLFYPDHIARMKMRWEHGEKLLCLLSLLEVESSQLDQMGIVELDGPVIKSIIEKPPIDQTPSNIASLPLYCFSHQILEILPEIDKSIRGEFEIQSGIQLLIERFGQVEGIFVDKRIRINKPSDLLEINREFLTAGFEQPQIQPQVVGHGTHLIAPIYIERGTLIGSNCVIGPNVYIERDCKIGDNVTIENSLLLHGVSVSSKSEIIDQIIT